MVCSTDQRAATVTEIRNSRVVRLVRRTCTKVPRLSLTATIVAVAVAVVVVVVVVVVFVV